VLVRRAPVRYYLFHQLNERGLYMMDAHVMAWFFTNGYKSFVEQRPIGRAPRTHAEYNAYREGRETADDFMCPF
jgi:hypothetical protein